VDAEFLARQILEAVRENTHAVKENTRTTQALAELIAAVYENAKHIREAAPRAAGEAGAHLLGSVIKNVFRGGNDR